MTLYKESLLTPAVIFCVYRPLQFTFTFLQSGYLWLDFQIITTGLRRVNRFILLRSIPHIWVRFSNRDIFSFAQSKASGLPGNEQQSKDKNTGHLVPSLMPILLHLTTFLEVLSSITKDDSSLILNLVLLHDIRIVQTNSYSFPTSLETLIQF